MKENYILTEYIKEVELSEIDFDLSCDIVGEDCEYYDFITKENGGRWTGESEPVKIDVIIKTLEKLKKKGANYVEVMYHCDHRAYVFNGAKITKATPEEIYEHIISNKREEFQEKAIKAIKLQKELDKLNEELNV